MLPHGNDGRAPAFCRVNAAASFHGAPPVEPGKTAGASAVAPGSVMFCYSAGGRKAEQGSPPWLTQIARELDHMREGVDGREGDPHVRANPGHRDNLRKVVGGQHDSVVDEAAEKIWCGR